MFSRTPDAKIFRLWLARLPKQVRQFIETLPDALEEAERRGAIRGAARVLALMESNFVSRMGTRGLGKLIWYRLQGLTQQEAATLLNLTVAGVREMECPLKETVVFKATSDALRQREVRLALAAALAGTGKPQPPSPERDA